MNNFSRLISWTIPLVILLSGCNPTPSLEKQVRPRSPEVAIVGDIDLTSDKGIELANEIVGNAPEAILTTGDNAYSPEGYSALVGGVFKSYIEQNMFYPAYGNHDQIYGKENFLELFPYLSSETNYKISIDNVDYFFIDSESALSTPESFNQQQSWLDTETAKSRAKYKVVVMHQPPFTSGIHHGPTKQMRWNFRELGVSLVLSGHEHIYERLFIDGVTYIVTGLGGKSQYNCGQLVVGSNYCNDRELGALWISNNDDGLLVTYKNLQGKSLDQAMIPTRSFSGL